MGGRFRRLSMPYSLPVKQLQWFNSRSEPEFFSVLAPSYFGPYIWSAMTVFRSFASKVPSRGRNCRSIMLFFPLRLEPPRDISLSGWNYGVLIPRRRRSQPTFRRSVSGDFTSRCKGPWRWQRIPSGEWSLPPYTQELPADKTGARADGFRFFLFGMTRRSRQRAAPCRLLRHNIAAHVDTPECRFAGTGVTNDWYSITF